MSTTTQRFGRRLKNRQEKSENLFVKFKEEEDDDNDVVESNGGPDDDFMQDKSASSGMNTKTKLIIIGIASLIVGALAFLKLRDVDGADNTNASKWAVIISGAIAGVLVYLFFFYKR